MERLIRKLYELRKNFIVIGLTGRTGSGCSTVADVLSSQSLRELPSNYPEYVGMPDVERRKNRIVYEFMDESDNWWPFTVIKASDVIFYFAFLQDFETFKRCFIEAGKDKKDGRRHNLDDKIAQVLDEENLKNKFGEMHGIAVECENFLENLRRIPEADYDSQYQRYADFLLHGIGDFRNALTDILGGIGRRIISGELQRWGTNIRRCGSINARNDDFGEDSPSYLASKINDFIKMFRRYNNLHDRPTNIVIDALRNPFEILFFRERYSAFYNMAVSTTKQIREQHLFRLGYSNEDVDRLNEEEKGKGDLLSSYTGIDVDRCIELSDIYIAHDDTPAEHNKNLVDKIITYIALIKHPGLVPPTAQERLMQVACAARVNSGCLSRQVGAAVTDRNYSVKSIGWNTPPAGQTPCTLRSLRDLLNQKDDIAFSDYEKNDLKFQDRVNVMGLKYMPERRTEGADVPYARLRGLNLGYCFKDYYTDMNFEKQSGNQVHTRSLHAEENAFLQLAKYGTEGIEGGCLFTTASCCELCGKKAYQLGIRKIIYIDTYPGITEQHILGAGTERPEMELFIGAVGRAYVSLYNPMLSQKDEIEALTGVNVKINKQKAVNQRPPVEADGDSFGSVLDKPVRKAPEN